MKKTNNNVTITVANDGDLEVIYQLACRIWREHYPGIITEEQIDYMLENYCSVTKMGEAISHENTLFYLVNVDGQPLGYMAIKPDIGTKQLFVSKMYLDSAVRGRGIGQKMLDFITDVARKNALTSLYLAVNKENTIAIQAYERNGFFKEKEMVTDIGNGFVMDDFQMRKDLIT